MLTSQCFTVILCSSIWFCVSGESSSAGQVLLSSSARAELTSRGSTCPTGNVTFTCTGRNLSSNTIRWYINSNQASSYMLTTSPPPPYPITVNSIGTDIEVIVVSAQVDNGMFTFINTTLTTRVDYITPNSIGCGTFKVINKIKLSCSLPAPFLVEPSDGTCGINSNVIFRCKPSKKGVNITWNVNEKFNYSSNFTTKNINDESQLHVTGCSLEWNGYIIKCVIRTATRDIYSNSSILTVEDVNSQTLDFLGDHVGEIIAFLCGVVVSGVITILLFCCITKQKQKKDEDMQYNSFNYERYELTESDLLERNVKRIKREDRRKREALKNCLPERYKHVRDLPELGKRLQKHWYLVHDTHKKRDLILTRAPVSKKCELTLDKHGHLETLNRMLRELRARNHFLLNAEEIILDPSDANFIFIFQPLMEKGSLKDLIYKTADLITNPGKQSVVDIDWKHKYKGRGHLLSADQVSQYGRQILEGITFLYDLGFPPLGHIQTGDIFVEGDTCRLGGYENMLLGYSTRLHKTIAEENSNLSPKIDIIAFGHVIYEMSAGRDLMGIIPSEEDYEHVGDENCKEILKYIFTLREDGQLKHAIPKILKHPFFKHKQNMYWTEGMKDVLNLAGRRRVVVGEAEGKTSTGIRLGGVVKGITDRFKARKSSDSEMYYLMESNQERVV